MKPLPPGSTIGILGGGQLGRMLAVAAAQLGYNTRVLAPDEEAVAAQTAASFTRADYHSRIVLDEFASAADVVTYEFENIDIEPVDQVRGEGFNLDGGNAIEQRTLAHRHNRAFIDEMHGDFRTNLRRRINRQEIDVHNLARDDVALHFAGDDRLAKSAIERQIDDMRAARLQQHNLQRAFVDL